MGRVKGNISPMGSGERFDCRDWARYAQERFGTRQNIFLMGISMGASTVLMASGLELPDTVRGIVADCGFTTPWDIMAHVAKRDFKLPAFPLLYALDLLARIIAGFGLREADTRRALQKNTRPVLFLHGREDDFVPLRMTEENSRACKAEQELYLVRGAGHAQSFARDTAGCEEKNQDLCQGVGRSDAKNCGFSAEKKQKFGLQCCPPHVKMGLFDRKRREWKRVSLFPSPFLIAGYRIF